MRNTFILCLLVAALTGYSQQEIIVRTDKPENRVCQQND